MPAARPTKVWTLEREMLSLGNLEILKFTPISLAFLNHGDTMTPK
jgi:hypothetical protein